MIRPPSHCIYVCVRGDTGALRISTICTGCLSLNSTQTGVFREEGSSIEKRLPEDPAVGKPARNFLNQ